ncbi:hypothetical protein PCL_01612 [Purpureocillium lilacinum]|uniref:Uncharacterized protein n=1 Tax=Purpureocillium lilacinum TaxID=33203 RepID=A0A2U3E1Z2_PURLI|nr:hypothetical protein PCL_01612 [Purpureocillium lilacinum]
MPKAVLAHNGPTVAIRSTSTYVRTNKHAMAMRETGVHCQPDDPHMHRHARPVCKAEAGGRNARRRILATGRMLPRSQGGFNKTAQRKRLGIVHSSRPFSGTGQARPPPVTKMHVKEFVGSEDQAIGINSEALVAGSLGQLMPAWAQPWGRTDEAGDEARGAADAQCSVRRAEQNRAEQCHDASAAVQQQVPRTQHWPCVLRVPGLAWPGPGTRLVGSRWVDVRLAKTCDSDARPEIRETPFPPAAKHAGGRITHCRGARASWTGGGGESRDTWTTGRHLAARPLRLAWPDLASLAWRSKMPPAGIGAWRFHWGDGEDGRRHGGCGPWILGPWLAWPGLAARQPGQAVAEAALNKLPSAVLSPRRSQKRRAAGRFEALVWQTPSQSSRDDGVPGVAGPMSRTRAADKELLVIVRRSEASGQRTDHCACLEETRNAMSRERGQ